VIVCFNSVTPNEQHNRETSL